MSHEFADGVAWILQGMVSTVMRAPRLEQVEQNAAALSKLIFTAQARISMR